MKERLQKLIAAAGLCSRRRAEEWITQGKVTVNGALARLGDSADPATDRVLVEGRPLPSAPAASTTILLNKPRGVVTTRSDEKGRTAVTDLLPPELGSLYPVGRLDMFSEGLLLLTNDGELTQRLTHPSGQVSKTYRLWVTGWRPAALEALRRPIRLDGFRIKPPQVRLLWTAAERRQEPPPVGAHSVRPQGSGIRDQASGIRDQGSGNKDQGSGIRGVGAHTVRPQSASNGKAGEQIAALEITIHEGRNRQIRRMAQAAGLTVTRLKRIAEGPLTLGDLKPGEWRRLTEEELSQLKMEG